MRRRSLLGLVAGSGIASVAGCLDADRASTPTASITLTDPTVAVDDPPVVTVDGDSVTVRGTVRYGSSQCGTVEVAYRGYEATQDRLDLLVAAVDDGATDACTDDLVETGYRVTTTVTRALTSVAVTEHHVFGATYSTTVDRLDDAS